MYSIFSDLPVFHIHFFYIYIIRIFLKNYCICHLSIKASVNEKNYIHCLTYGLCLNYQDNSQIRQVTLKFFIRMQNQIVKIKCICDFSIPAVGNEITNLNVNTKIQTKRRCPGPMAVETMNQAVFYDIKILHRN